MEYDFNEYEAACYDALAELNDYEKGLNYEVPNVASYGADAPMFSMPS